MNVQFDLDKYLNEAVVDAMEMDGIIGGFLDCVIPSVHHSIVKGITSDYIDGISNIFRLNNKGEGCQHFSGKLNEFFYTGSMICRNSIQIMVFYISDSEKTFNDGVKRMICMNTETVYAVLQSYSKIEEVNDLEHQFSGYFNAANAGLIITTLEGNILRKNEVMKKILHDNGDLLNFKIDEIFELLGFEKQIYSEKDFPLEVRGNVAGEEKWFLLNRSIINTARPSVIYSFSDITSAKKRESTNFLVSNIINNLEAAVVIFDSSMKIVQANRFFSTVSGKSPGVIYNSNIFEIFEAERRQFYEIIREISKNTRWKGELSLKSGDEEHILDWEIIYNQVNNDENGVYIALGRDITQRKKMEDNLRQSVLQSDLVNRKLAEAVSEARELAVKADAASKTKSSFLANVSHEIRTPLNGIIGMAGLLAETELSPEQEEYTGLITTSARTLLDIINDILQFSKIEAGVEDTEEVSFDLRSIMDEVLDIVDFQAFEKRVKILPFIEEDLVCQRFGEHSKIRQIIVNLVHNAVKFTDSGQVKISLGRPQGMASDSYVRICVEDTGVGIAEKDIDRIFEPFIQADNSSTRKFGGSGLGLSIVSRHIKNMGGSISVKSEVGAGSTFTVDLPLKINDSTEKESCGKTCAVVCSDPTLMESIVSILKITGLSVELLSDDTCRDLGKLRIIPWDYVFTGEDAETKWGISAALRKKSGDVRTILLSFRSNATTARLRKSGCDAIITVPLRYAHLIELMADFAGETKIYEAVSTNPREAGRILVAEDSIINQKVIGRMLETMGYRFDVSSDGNEAVDMASKFRYDLIIMDMKMPEMDGLSATQTIRELELTGQIETKNKILGMTASTLSEDHKKCVASGMNSVITKPVEYKKLKEIIRSFLGKVSSEMKVVEPMEATTQTFNLDKLLEKIEYDRDMAQSLCEVFESEYGYLPSRMKTEINEQNAGALRSSAHLLKGASETLGAEKLAQVALHIEQKALSGRLELTEELVKLLEVEMESLFQEFRVIFAGRSNA
ncbi:response regulator [Myxococcota bacterium]|nr:response regulator [Myxococcota bacterium]MBU1381114.1 response regulator [Myxococcota bacterium]MBU1496529.1 response regulator [Myxococcota bacterium]